MGIDCIRSVDFYLLRTLIVLETGRVNEYLAFANVSPRLRDLVLVAKFFPKGRRVLTMCASSPTTNFVIDKRSESLNQATRVHLH